MGLQYTTEQSLICPRYSHHLNVCSKFIFSYKREQFVAVGFYCNFGAVYKRLT